MKKKFTYVYTFFVFLLLISMQFFSTSFFGGAHNQICSNCHGGGTDPGGSVIVTGVPAAYAHSTLYPIEVCVTDPSKLGAGFNMVVNIGSFIAGTSVAIQWYFHYPYFPTSIRRQYFLLELHVVLSLIWFNNGQFQRPGAMPLI